MVQRQTYVLHLPTGQVLQLGGRTLVMGVLNVTPDSFSDGGRFPEPGLAVDAALRMVEDGADLIDIGGESSRPGAEPVSVEEEWARVEPVLRTLSRRTSVPISIDTCKAAVARAAVDAGAAIVNDVSGLRHEPSLARVVADRRAALILMHRRGQPGDMGRFADYRSVVDEVAGELAESIRLAMAGGVAREALILDPGLGFAKQARHSFEVLARLDAPPLLALDRPWLIGASRKSFLASAIGDTPAHERDWATAAAVSAAAVLGAHIVRVHRVREMVQVVRVIDAVRSHRDIG